MLQKSAENPELLAAGTEEAKLAFPIAVTAYWLTLFIGDIQGDTVLPVALWSNPKQDYNTLTFRTRI